MHQKTRRNHEAIGGEYLKNSWLTFGLYLGVAKPTIRAQAEFSMSSLSSVKTYLLRMKLEL